MLSNTYTHTHTEPSSKEPESSLDARKEEKLKDTAMRGKGGTDDYNTTLSHRHQIRYRPE